MRATSLSVVLVAVVLSAGASLAQTSDEEPSLNETDPFVEQDELFENASDPFASYEQAAQEAENVTLVDPNPVAEEDDEADQAPPPADPGAEEERSTPGLGLLVTLAGLCLALLVRPRR